MNGDYAVDTLQAQTEAAIRDIEAANNTKACEAHAPMASGTVILLRWQLARFRHMQHNRWTGWRDTILIVSLMLAALKLMPVLADWLS